MSKKSKNQISFADAAKSVEAVRVAEVTGEIQAAFAARAQYEFDTNALNDNIQKTLAKITKGMTTDGIVRALVVATEGATGFINTQEVKNKRRNVYALDKARDLLYGAVTGHLKNAINIAILKSLKAMTATGRPFGMVAAKASASDKVAVDSTLKSLLTRHTVSEATAPTQASSTMTALEDLGVVKNTGTRQQPVWELVNGPLTERLMEIS